MMINVNFSNNMGTKSFITDSRNSIRTALENEGINYSGACLMIDGAFAAVGDLDRTFDELEIGDHCQITSIIKTCNAASVKVVGNAMVFESVFETEQLLKLRKFRPAALTLKDGDKDIFRIDVGDAASINRYGAVFSSQNAAGKATCTVIAPEGVTPDAEYITENYGASLMLLRKLESSIRHQIEEVDAEAEEIRGMIEIL